MALSGNLSFIISVCIVFATGSDGVLTSEIDFKEVMNITLAPRPYVLEGDNLLTKNKEDRQKLCDDMSLKIPRYQVLKPAYTYYVPVAQMYVFDDQKFLAIRCPTIPVLYVFHESIDDSDQWYIRIINTRMDQYKFAFETNRTVMTISESSAQKPPVTHHFYQFDKTVIWLLCHEALKYIRYKAGSKAERDNYQGFSGPKKYEFKYDLPVEWIEIYHAIKCFKEPQFYLHTGQLEISKIITISLQGTDTTKKYEMNPMTDVIVRAP